MWLRSATYIFWAFKRNRSLWNNFELRIRFGAERLLCNQYSMLATLLGTFEFGINHSEFQILNRPMCKWKLILWIKMWECSTPKMNNFRFLYEHWVFGIDSWSKIYLRKTRLSARDGLFFRLYPAQNCKSMDPNKIQKKIDFILVDPKIVFVKITEIGTYLGFS